MASLLQPPPPSLSLLLLFLSTSLTRLEWVQMCDPQTLPLWSPYWSHRAQQRLAHSSEELLAKVSPHSHIICRAIVRWVIEVLQLNAGRHFITQSDLMGCNLTAHIARINIGTWETTLSMSKHTLNVEPGNLVDGTCV